MRLHPGCARMSLQLQSIEKVSLLAFLVSSMLATGLGLKLQAILGPLRDCRRIVLVLGLNFVVAPAFAWLLTKVIPLREGHAVGLLLLAGAAGAPFLPKLVQIAHGDVGSAVAFMVVLTVGTILFMTFALPLIIPGIKASPWEITRPLLLIIVAPMMIGMIVMACLPSVAPLAAHFLSNIANVSLVIFFVLLIALNVEPLFRVIGSGAIVVSLVYVLGLFALGWTVGGPSPEMRGGVALSAAARNFGAALVPAANSFNNRDVTIMVAVSAIVGLATCFPAAVWVRRRTIAAAS